jgi:hypothetical protein
MMEIMKDVSPSNEGTGILICEAAGILISPILLIQSVCSDRYPKVAQARWIRALPTSPNQFRKTGSLPILFGESDRILFENRPLQLFAVDANAKQSFEKESRLEDWQWPALLAGMIIIVDRKFENSFPRPLKDQILDYFKPKTEVLNPTLEWAKNQNIPFVIAALGYPDNTESISLFRQRYALAPAVPIVAGPALSDKRLDKSNSSSSTSSGIFQFVLAGGQLAMSTKFTQQVLTALGQIMETPQR